MRLNPFRRRPEKVYLPFPPEPESAPPQEGGGRKVTGHDEVVRELVRALGIDPATTRAVTLRMAVGEAVSVEVEGLSIDTHLRKVTEVVQRRQVVAPPPLPLDPFQVMAGALL